MLIRTCLLVSMLTLAACSARGEDDDDDLDFDATDWSAQLTARASSNVRGAATASSVGFEGGAGTATATVEIRGAAPGARHPWHVHTGTCASGGPILGEANDYEVLEAAADGTDEQTAAISDGMDDGTRYHINVHRSPSDLTVISCGDLVD